MRRYLRLLKIFWKYNFMRETTYRSDFFVWTGVTFGWLAFSLIFYNLLFLHVNTVAGWNKGQLLTLQGFMFIIDFVLWGLMYPNFSDLPLRVNRGLLDFDLTKPIDLQFLLSFRKFSLSDFNNLLIGSSLIAYGLSLAGMKPTLFELSAGIIFFLVAIIFLYACYFSSVCLTFWVERLSNIVYFFPELRQFATLPEPAYHGILRTVFVGFLPIVLVSTVPARWLFGIVDLTHSLQLVICAAASLLASRVILHYSLKRYSSSGS